MNMTHSGTIALKTKTGSRVFVQNVYYSPSTRANILSVSQLARRRKWFTSFTTKGAEVKSPTGEVVLEATAKPSGMYELDVD